MKQTTFDLAQMVALRLEDPIKWTYSALGRHFHKDHTTIMYHCQRLGIRPPQVDEDELERRRRNKELIVEVRQWRAAKQQKPKPVSKYAHLLEDEVLNPGKSYKEYLADALTRPIEKRYHEIYYKTYEGLPHKDYYTGITTLATILEEETRGEHHPDSPDVVP